MPSSFADRLWWSRHRAGLGATKLARLVGCAQSLVAHIENQNAEKSQFNNEFAKALHVDPTWLAHGVADRAPQGWDEEEARGRGKHKGLRPVRVQLPSEAPRWAQDEHAQPLAPLTGADAMMKGLIADFMDFAKLAGPERAVALLTTLRHVADLMSAKEAGGQDQIRVPD